MPVNLERFGIAIRQQAKVGVFFERPGDVNQVAVSFGDQRGISQTLANRFGDIEAVVPLGTSFTDPSGSLTWMLSAIVRFEVECFQFIGG